VHLLIFRCYVTVWPIVGQHVLFIGNYIFFVIRCFFSIIEIYLALQKTVKDSCRQQFVDYICSSEVFRWILNHNIICFESCLVFPPMLFLFRVRGCYAVIVDFDSFLGCACIFIMLDEQGHLLGYF